MVRKNSMNLHQEMCKMKFGEAARLEEFLQVRRVPGGWIYEYFNNRSIVCAIFVSYKSPNK